MGAAGRAGGALALETVAKNNRGYLAAEYAARAMQLRAFAETIRKG